MTEMFRLVAKSGLTRGVSWPVGDATLCIGRDKDCDISIDDPLVSRRHCEVSVIGEALHLVDLGSRNATLVNGKPARRCILAPGDEIALGNVILVAVQEKVRSAGARTRDPQSTLTLPVSEALYAQGSGADLLASGSYETVQDLVDLYTYIRDFRTAVDKEDVLGRVEACVLGRFQPAGFWIGLTDGLSDMRFRAVQGPAQTPGEAGLHDLVQKALRDDAALLAPLTRTEGAPFRNAAIAPFSVGGRLLGILCLVSGPNQPPYDERSLQMLIGIASAAAPWYVALERQEDLELERNALRRGAPIGAVFVGRSPAAARVRQLAQKAAVSPLPVLLQGETGTGKELVAGLIHESSARRNGPFIAVNCAALPSDLILSELFGHERGAFTGALKARDGLFSAAHGGTLFLDEIGELPVEQQAMLLRVLETGRYRRVGGVREYAVECGLISATNRSLANPPASREFRQDLYHRIAGFTIALPPLRERTDDIPELVEYFFEWARRDSGQKVRGVDPAAVAALQKRRWPGNVRELKMAVQRAIHMAHGDYLRIEDFDLEDGAEAEPVLTMTEVEQVQMRRALEASGGDVQAAAARLGIGRSTFYKKMRLYGIPQKDVHP